MKKPSKVSLIIPIYNGENHLSKALESAINQSLRDIEIIIINDGSTDNTASLLEQFNKSDKRIHIKTQPKNIGLGAARNLGIEMASGDFLYFLDADDYLHPNALEILYNQAISENLDILQSKFIRKNRNSKKILPKELVPLPKAVDSVEYFHQDFFISPTSWAKLYKTEFIINHNIKFKNIYFEDMPFVFEAISKAKRINNNMAPTYIYQKQENSITSSFSEKHIDDYIYVLNELQVYFLREDLTDKYATFPIHYYLFLARLSDMAIKNGNSEQKKKVKTYVDNQARKYKQFIINNKNYPFLKRMALKSSPYNYALLSQALKPKKHK